MATAKDDSTGDKWEYKTVSLANRLGTLDERLDKSLNLLGEQGWELVAANPFSSFVDYTFKRKVRRNGV